MSYIVSYKAKGAMHCEAIQFGPFAEYMDAEDFLCELPAAIDCDYKMIEVCRNVHGFRQIRKDFWQQFGLDLCYGNLECIEDYAIRR